MTLGELPSVEWIMTLVAGLISVVVFVYKKLGAIKWVSNKSEEKALYDHVRAEKDLAINQRDECVEAKKVLDEQARLGEEQVKDLLLKMEVMERRLYLLETLNLRLSQSLDRTRELLQSATTGP